jgi:hypothetical protein
MGLQLASQISRYHLRLSRRFLVTGGVCGALLPRRHTGEYFSL